MSSSSPSSDSHRLSRFPQWISRWLGYRPVSPNSSATPPPARLNYVVWIWSFVGAFLSISLIQAIFGQARYFIERGVPSIITSYGASAVLIYGVTESPLAQPRPLIFGHFLGALTGLCITKLFRVWIPAEDRFEDLLWLAASLSCATSIVVMQMTQTVHPPGGATALLPALSADVRAIGWYYLPIVLFTSTLALVVALINNNIQRRYPLFWISPSTPSHPSPVTSLVMPSSKEEVVLDGMMDEAKNRPEGSALVLKLSV